MRNFNQQKRRLYLKAIIASIAVLLCQPFLQGAEKSKGPATSAIKGQTLYTQFGLFYEGLVHRTTNYRKGIFVPVNTEVTFVKATKKVILVKLPNGKELKIQNVEEYSGEDIDGIFTRTFSTEKVDLSKFTEAERKGIAAGEAVAGMKKAAVIVALGYPPKHQTPSLESSKWRYWRNRFGTFLVNFDGDVVSSIKD